MAALQAASQAVEAVEFPGACGLVAWLLRDRGAGHRAPGRRRAPGTGHRGELCEMLCEADQQRSSGLRIAGFGTENRSVCWRYADLHNRSTLG